MPAAAGARSRSDRRRREQARASSSAPARASSSAPARQPAQNPSLDAWRGALAVGWALILGCSPNQPRDVVTESQDVRQVGGEDAAQRGDYEYVTKRAHVALGLVGKKRLSSPEAQKIVDALGDEFEICARRQEAAGRLVKGAARLVIFGDARGNADVSDVQLAPGGPVAANALECLVAPARAQALPAPTSAGVTALALEASWGPDGP